MGSSCDDVIVRLAWLVLWLTACGRLGFEASDTPLTTDATPPDPMVSDCSTLADGTPCDDRNICTTTSTCQAGTCASADVASNCQVADSTSEFATTQGVDGWFYGFWAPDGNAPYNPDTDFAAGVYVDTASAYEPMVPAGEFIYLAWWGVHPKGNPLTIPIRRWVSDVSGPASVQVAVRKGDTSCGDGVGLRLVVDGAIKLTKEIAGNDGTGVMLPVAVELAIGTRVELQITPRDGDACDTTETELTIVSPSE